jgi:hypothetical protein
MREDQKMKHFIIFITTFFLFAFFSGCNTDRKSSSEADKSINKPNIFFIFADDQCYLTVHALRNNEITTPNPDKLVNTGATITYTYNMGAWSDAVCFASRAMLNTGCFVWRAYNCQLKKPIPCFNSTNI